MLNVLTQLFKNCCRLRRGGELRQCNEVQPLIAQLFMLPGLFNTLIIIKTGDSAALSGDEGSLGCGGGLSCCGLSSFLLLLLIEALAVAPQHPSTGPGEFWPEDGPSRGSSPGVSWDLSV